MLERITVMLETAKAAGVKYPAFVIQGQSNTVVLKLVGSGANAGCVNASSSKRFGEGVWYGRIDRDGRWVGNGREENLARRCAKFLAAFVEDPARVGKASAKLTGACCFCSKTLTTIESRTAGYGPICAARYGLPWGEKAAEMERSEPIAFTPATVRAPAEECASCGDTPCGYGDPGNCAEAELAERECSGPEPGTWAYTARAMAAIGDDDGMDWDAWKDEMKERG